MLLHSLLSPTLRVHCQPITQDSRPCFQLRSRVGRGIIWNFGIQADCLYSQNDTSLQPVTKVIPNSTTASGSIGWFPFWCPQGIDLVILHEWFESLKRFFFCYIHSFLLSILLTAHIIKLVWYITEVFVEKNSIGAEVMKLLLIFLTNILSSITNLCRAELLLC